MPGRSCDAPDSDDNDPLLTCEMEDGTSISVEAVSAKMTNAEAEKQCVNPYADSPEEIEVELKPKKGFAMLWCTTKVRDWSKQAAEKRIAAAEPVPELEPVHADYDITYG